MGRQQMHQAEMAAHLDREHRDGQRQRDPESPGHVDHLRIGRVAGDEVQDVGRLEPLLEVAHSRPGVRVRLLFDRVLRLVDERGACREIGDRGERDAQHERASAEAQRDAATEAARRGTYRLDRVPHRSGEAPEPPGTGHYGASL